MLNPAQPPVTGVGEVMTRRARMPRLVKRLFATVNDEMAGPVPFGPAWMTASFASRRSNL
jgi:hypothetical protein